MKHEMVILLKTAVIWTHRSVNLWQFFFPLDFGQNKQRIVEERLKESRYHAAATALQLQMTCNPQDPP